MSQRLVETIFSVLFFACVTITWGIFDQKQKEMNVYKESCANAERATAMADSAARHYFIKYIKCKTK